MTLGLTTALLVVVLAGVGAAVHVGQGHPAAGVAAAAEVRTDTPPSAPSGTVTSAAAVTPPSTNQTVRLTAVAGRDPRATAYQAAIQALFDAINAHDYPSWVAAVTTAESEAQGPVAWTRSYSSTSDSNITVQSIAGDRVQITFVSTQDVDLAPADLPVTCIDWSLSVTMARPHGRWVVGPTVPGSVTMASCAPTGSG